MTTNLCAFSLADFSYYVTCYGISSISSDATGNLWLWGMSSFLMLMTPHFVKSVQGGTWDFKVVTAEDKARAFVVYQAKLLGCYCIWYAWYDNIFDLEEADLFNGWGETNTALKLYSSLDPHPNACRMYWR